jgi:hypothetical protein
MSHSYMVQGFSCELQIITYLHYTANMLLPANLEQSAHNVGA